MKLAPIIPRNKAAETLFGLISNSLCLKKIRQNIANIPVFITGVAIEQRIEPNKSFLFLSALAMNPATTPAKVVFSKHARIVPNGLTAKKQEIVLGENKVKAPETNPKNPPTTGPYKIAPKVIIIKEKFKLAKPPGITM